MIEYLVDILGQGSVVLEVMSKLFEVGVDEILDTYQMFRDEEMKMLDY